MAKTYRRWDGKQYQNYLTRFGLPEKKPFKDFSRGMKMKLAIAVALSHSPRLLVLDEATAGLDPIVRDEVLEIFKIIRGYGGSAVCATQDLNDFFALEDGKYGKGIINNSKTKVILNLEDEEAQRVGSILHLSEAELMEITHFERGSALISTNNNNVAVEIKCSELEKELITTDRRELQELLKRNGKTS